MKTASEMTYTVSGGALNSTQSNQSNPISNDGALGFFEDDRPNKNNQKNKTSSDIGPVHDLKKKEQQYAVTHEHCSPFM